MKKLLTILALAALIPLSANATERNAQYYEHYKGGSYCTRTLDAPEVFRIGLPRSSYKPHASDCEVQFKGNAAAIHGCRLERCDIYMSGAGR